MPEIQLPLQIEQALNEQLTTIDQIKAQQQRDLKIIFAMEGIDFPKDAKFKLEHGKLTWDEPQ
jgi:hypothetical protein